MNTVKIEGQEYQIGDEFVNGGATIQESDRLLREALTPNYPIAAGATFQREMRGGQPYITLVKQPGAKGGQHALQALLDASEEINPAVILACEMHLLEGQNALNVEALLTLQPRIDEAIKSGASEERRMGNALSVLTTAPAVVSSDVPSGL